jgi:hypothetical protein
MAMMEANDNVLIFGPAASGKKDALERCIEEYGQKHKVALLTRKTALLHAAYKMENITCLSWDKTVKTIDPSWLNKNYEFIIIDGYCENWKELLEEYPTSRFIMAMRATSNKDIPEDLKKSYRIIAKCGFIEVTDKQKGILSVRKYKG